MGRFHHDGSARADFLFSVQDTFIKGIVGGAVKG